METLLIFLACGAIVASVTGYIRQENAGEFLMRLTLIEAMQVIVWLIIGQ